MVHAMRVEALNDAAERAEQAECERDELREELLDAKKERIMIADWLVDITDKFVAARDQLEAARFMAAGWRRKANQLEDVNAEWAAEMSRVLIEAVDIESLVKVALPDIKFAAWLLLHASTQKVNEHRSMADSASIITQHIERIEESFKKQER